MEPGLLLFSLLSNAADVVAIASTRIFPVRVPQGVARPYISYQLVSNTSDGLAACRLDDVSRVQVSIFADDYAVMTELAGAVKAALNGYRVGQLLIDYDTQRDQDDPLADCLLRVQDYTVEAPDDQQVPVVNPALSALTAAEILAGTTDLEGLQAALSQPVTVTDAYGTESPVSVEPGDAYACATPPPVTVTDPNTTPSTVYTKTPGQSLTIPLVADVTCHDTYAGNATVLKRPGQSFTPTPAPAGTVTDANNPASPVSVAPGGTYTAFPIPDAPVGFAGMLPGTWYDVHNAVTQWTFAAGWTSTTASVYTNGRAAYTNVNTATATTTFYGTGLVLRCFCNLTTHGAVRVYIDGTLLATINLAETNAKYFTLSGLTRGVHTLLVRNAGDGKFIELDDILIVL